ncbi:MAG: methyl-accepting chemotaxis protein [Vicinamibacterales bacterium]
MAWTIGKKLYGGVGALALALALLVAASVYGVRLLHESIADLASEVAPNLALAKEIWGQSDTMALNARNAVIAAAQHDAAAVTAAKNGARAAVDRLKTDVDALHENAKLERVRDLTQEMTKEADAWWAASIGIWDKAAAFDGPAAVGGVAALVPHRKAIQAASEEIVKLQEGRLTAASETAERSYNMVVRLSMVLSVAALVVAGLVFWAVKGINVALTRTASELKEGADQVRAASGQVATAAQSLSQGSTEQAASLEETSASLEEMLAMTRQNADNSQQAATLMADVDRQVAQSNQVLRDMVSSMENIRESSTKVAKIIKTIDEIAFQTNILALNAAVEAARAGEAGMGFAVVADEVRNLAQRSAQAAKDTASLIDESSANATAGSTKVEQVTSVIGEITDSVSKVKSLVDEVSVASKQQAQGIDQVTQAVAQMEKVTQTTAATAEESAAASEELNAQAETTRTVVGHLQEMVSGAATDVGVQHWPSGASLARKVLPMVRPAKVVKASRAPATARMAEQDFPLDDTGTYGRF